jgi:hypothetical protein
VIACRPNDDETPGWLDPHIYHLRSADEITRMLRAARFDHIDHEPGDAETHAIHLFVASLAH